MQNIAYAIIVLAFLINFILTSVPGGRVFRLSPEMLSAVVALVVALRIGQRFPIVMAPRYLIFFVVFLLAITAGIATNAVQPGAIFAGLLIYLRYIPFFLLPVMVDYSREEIVKQLKLILGLALLQFPIAFMQRFVAHKGEASGDSVIGTLGLSSNLSIVLIGCAAVVMGFYLKGFITTGRFLLILFLLLVPTMINETTVSLFLIPLAMIVPTLFVKGIDKIKLLLQVSGIATLVLVVFVVVYNSYYSRWGGDVLSVITEGRLLEYVYKGADVEARTDEGREQSEIGRMDSIVLPFKLIHDPVTLLIGHGVGNVSDISAERLQGAYLEMAISKGAGMTTLSYLIWETGIVGAVLSIVVLLMILRDAAVLSRGDDVFAALALGWTGVIAVLLVTLAYQNLIPVAPIGMLMWYLGGVIVSQRYRMTQTQNSRPYPPPLNRS